jgi:hypothetical protein
MVILLSIATPSFSQGVYRSFGIGVRGSIWKYRDSGSEKYNTASVQNSPGGGMLYFFARLVDRWYLEASIGGFTRQVIAISGVENVSMTPLLLGARYDLLSSKHGSFFQPYLSFGAGTFLIDRNIVSGAVINESDAEFGLFFGIGVNVIMTEWFALNSDVKYHMINHSSSFTSNLSGLQLSIGFSFMFGSTPELLRIEDINVIVKDIYPAYHQFYSTYPIAQVTVRNMVSYPIEVNLHSNIEGYSERTQESGFIQIKSGETEKIPVFAIFGEKLLYASQRQPAVIDMSLEVRAGATQIEKMSVNVVIHSRNAWNGQIERLHLFLTPDDDGIMELSRGALKQLSEDEINTSNNLYAARVIFNRLGESKIQYQSDPNIPFYKDDYVQYATETLEKGTGDCDDLVVLYASLLESIGISTAFIEVKDPQKEIAHLYLMFDSGLPPEQGHLISSNDKRYVIRHRLSGKKSIWIPVESTLVNKGFDQAWEAGATAYLQEGILRAGLTDGWMRIIDVD